MESLGLMNVPIGYLLVHFFHFPAFFNPNGIPDFPIEWLRNSPFTNYFIPGLVLLIIVGFGNVFAGTVTFLRARYSGIIAALLGIFLMLYMAAEVWFIGLRNFLQPLYFILGAIILILSLGLYKIDYDISSKGGWVNYQSQRALPK